MIRKKTSWVLNTILLFLLLFVIASCGKTPQTDSDQAFNIRKEYIESLNDRETHIYLGQVFSINENNELEIAGIVLSEETNEYKLDVRTMPCVIPDDNDLSKIYVGMKVFDDLFKTVGMPTGSQSSGVASLSFQSSSGKTCIVFFDSNTISRVIFR